jgi:Tfp pilus assembly protein PilF
LLRANLAVTLIREGQYARAASELEQVLAHGVDAYPARRQRMLSLAYSKMNRTRDALDRRHESGRSVQGRRGVLHRRARAPGRGTRGTR